MVLNIKYIMESIRCEPLYKQFKQLKQLKPNLAKPNISNGN